MSHTTSLRELIERWRKESDDFERDGDEGSAASYYNCADELEGVIAALGEGQEAGAVAPVAYRKMVNTIGGPYWEFSTVFNAEHAISTGTTGYEPLYPSPAQTSEARDAARSEAYDKVDRFLRNTLMDAAYAEYSDALEIACGYQDAAMRQEGDTP